MRQLSTKVTNESAKSQSAWVELYDFYLPKAITTPWGNTSIIRITNGAGDIIFYTPLESPEPPASQGDSQTYHYWPIKRQLIKSSSKFANDKLALVLSNVTADFSAMLADIDWYDVPVVCRKIPASAAEAGPLSAGDAAIMFIAQIDSARITLETIQFTLSSAMASLSMLLPAENMHAHCRFKFGDDYCTQIVASLKNQQPKTAASGSTASQINSSFAGLAGQSCTANPSTDRISLSAHGLQNGHRVHFDATTPPGGIELGRWYYVVGATANDFQIATSAGGQPLDITSSGSGLAVTSECGFTEDSITSLGDDLIDALSNSAISASSFQSGYEPYRVKTSSAASDHWRFSDNPSNPNPSVNIYRPWIQFDFGSATNAWLWEFHEQSLARVISVQVSSDGSTWRDLSSSGPSLTTVAGRNVWRLITDTGSWRYWRLTCSKTGNAPWYAGDIIIRSAVARTSTTGSDLINSLSNSAITTSNEVSGKEGYRVKTSYGTGWAIDAPAADEFGLLDWGFNLQGYWQIPDSQSGLANPALKPWIQFDFGTAQAAGIWRIKQRDNVVAEQLPRLCLLFSSADGSSWAFQRYMELPPTAGAWSEFYLDSPPSHRYWRICVRSIWGDQITFAMLNKVQAFAGTLNYWANGWIRFDPDTPTAALRGLARRIISSKSGSISIEPLPVAPSAGDRFYVQRSCNNSFNSCARFLNTENYGGFDSLPLETIIR